MSSDINVFYKLTCVLDVVTVILLESHLRASVLVLDWRLGLETPGHLEATSLRHRAELAWRAESGAGGESPGAEDREQRVTSRTSGNRGWRRQEAGAEAGLVAAMTEVGVGGTHRHAGGTVAQRGVGERAGRGEAEGKGGEQGAGVSPEPNQGEGRPEL